MQMIKVNWNRSQWIENLRLWLHNLNFWIIEVWIIEVILYYILVFQPIDAADDVFIPEVDLSDKPWFKPEEEVNDIRVDTVKNISQALANIPLETKKIMGHQIDDMLQECIWDSVHCSPV